MAFIQIALDIKTVLITILFPNLSLSVSLTLFHSGLTELKKL